MENCGNALSLYQIHSQGANLIVTNVVTIMTDCGDRPHRTLSFAHRTYLTYVAHGYVAEYL